MTKTMTAMYASERPSAKDFHVPANSVEFTEAHLKKHLKFFNKDIYPEYFTDFEHKGITYVRTQLIDEDDLLKAKADPFGNQLYRPTKNKKYNAINESVDTEGVDLRKKPLQVVATLDENKKIISIDYLFNGNTLNQVLDAKILENRLCAIYEKNSNFSIPNLIEIGANQNSKDKPFGANDDVTLEHCLRVICSPDYDGYPIDENATATEVSEWVTTIKSALNFMSGGHSDMDSSKVNTIINDILEDKVKKTVARSITSGSQALTHLRKNGYVDTPTVRYGCLGALFKGVFPHFEKVYTQDELLKGTSDYFDYKKGRYEIIIHGGPPNMADPVNWFFTNMCDFWKRYNKLYNFTCPNGFIDNVNMKIIGAFQPLDCLDHIWPLDSVVEFEDIIEYRKNNLSKSGGIDIENDIEIEDIDLTSFVYSDATLDTILCASEPPTFG